MPSKRQRRRNDENSPYSILYLSGPVVSQHAHNLVRQPSGSDDQSAETVEKRHVRGASSNVNFPEIFWRRKWVILATCLGATCLAAAAALLAEPKYSATAIFDGDDREVAANPLNGGPPSEGEVAAATRMRSLAMAREIADQMGLAQQSTDKPGITDPLATPKSILSRFDIFKLWPGHASAAPSPLDIAAQRLMDNLQISIEPRSSLITVTYTSRNPQHAADVANAFVGEYLHYQRVRKLSDRQNSASRALLDAAASFGEKHPQVARARSNLDLVSAQLQSESVQTKTPSTADKLAATGRVMPAQSVTIPLSRGTLSKTLLGLLVGAFAGLGLAFLIELTNPVFRQKLLDRWLSPDEPSRNGMTETTQSILPNQPSNTRRN